jgi:hypothetical protein
VGNKEPHIMLWHWHAWQIQVLHMAIGRCCCRHRQGCGQGGVLLLLLLLLLARL